MMHDAYASTCSYRETIYSAPQFFLLSDNVFVGTVTSISNYTDHQWQVHFNIGKIWKGVATRQTSAVMTNTLQACGYSISVGEKYLVYANGSPSFINTAFTRMYADAQNDIALFDDPKFQAGEKTKEELNKKLKASQGRVESMMMDKRSHIPINGVGVDEVNSTLDINIDNTKTSLSAEEYQKRFKEILGDIPIKVSFGQYTALEPLIHIKSDKGNTGTHPLIHGTNSTNMLQSPLKQFKSGLTAYDVKCNNDLTLMMKLSDNSPACVKSQTGQKLVERGWGIFIALTTVSSGDLENSCGQFYTPPKDQGNSTKIPVLLINLNSTGCARYTFTIVYDYNSNPNGIAWSRIANFTSSIRIDDINFHGDRNQYGITSGKDYTSSFQITVIPDTVDLANFPIGSKFTVTYIIKPLPNATGFYDESILKPLCTRYPLAVGYGADQVDSSDFSMGLVYMQNPPCALGEPYKITTVEISGMNYKEMAIPVNP